MTAERASAEDPLSRTVLGSTADGSRSITARQIDYYSIDYSASGIANLTPAFKSTTSFGAQYYQGYAYGGSSGYNTFNPNTLSPLASSNLNSSVFGGVSPRSRKVNS